MENYLPEDEFYAYKDRLLAAFRDSELVKGYVAKRQPRLVADADLMLQIGYNYYSADQVNKWTAYDLEDYCLSHLPRKFMAGPSTFRQMGPQPDGFRPLDTRGGFGSERGGPDRKDAWATGGYGGGLEAVLKAGRLLAQPKYRGKAV